MLPKAHVIEVEQGADAVLRQRAASLAARQAETPAPVVVGDAGDLLHPGQCLESEPRGGSCTGGTGAVARAAAALAAAAWALAVAPDVPSQAWLWSG